MKTQREMFFGQQLTPPQFAQKYVIDGFKSYREAVVWCWDNRVRQGAGKDMDQAMCANFIGLHTPHMSRCVTPDSAAPMNLPPDCILDFEAFTGWRAISQYLAARSQLTYMEEVQEMMKSRGVQACA